MRSLKLIIAVAAISMSAAAAALAHAHLQKAEPPVGAVVSTPPSEVRLWFTQKLEPAFSWARVEDEHGQRVDRNDSQVDTADAAVMHISLKPLSPGAYKVAWRAVSVDTHVTEGNHIFRIATP